MKDYLKQAAIGIGAIILGCIIGIVAADFAAASEKPVPDGPQLSLEGLVSATAFVMCDDKPHLVGMVLVYVDGKTAARVIRIDAEHMYGFKTPAEIFEFAEHAVDKGVYSYGCTQKKANAPLPKSGTGNRTESL